MNRCRIVSLSPGVLAAALGSTLVLAGTPAAAQSVPTIDVGPAGPEQRLPLGQGFFLKGSPGTAERVNVVFVRTLFTPFSLGTPPACAKVESELKAVRPGVFAGTSLSPGALDGDAIWTGPGAGDRRALVAAEWTRPEKVEDKDLKYVVRVPEDSSFFRPGAHYCMFLYATDRPSLDAGKLVKAAEALRDALQCTGEVKGCEDGLLACLVTAGKECKGKEECKGAAETKCQEAERTCKDSFLAKCEDAALNTFEAQATSFIEEAKKKEWESCPGAAGDAKTCKSAIEGELRAAKRDLQDAAFLGAASRRRSIERAVAAWPRLHARKGAEETFSAGSLVAAERPFARFVLALLDRHHEVRSDASTGTLQYVHVARDGGVVKIAHLKIGEKLQTMEVAEDTKVAAKRAVLGLDTKGLLLPDSTVSLLDVLELARGRVWTGESYEPLHEAYATEALRTRERLGKLRDRLVSIRDVLRRANRAVATSGAVGAAAAPPIPGREVYAALGEWWGEVLTNDCKAWSALVQPGEELCAAAGGKGSVPAPLDGPYENLVQRIGNLARAEERMNGARARVEKLRGAARVKAAASVSATTSFAVKDWVTQHVNPTVGFAAALGPSEPIPLLYGGIKVYPWPNPVNEPMWSNGQIDLLRVVALEVALGTTSKGLGEDGRFSGPGAGTFPPVLIGGSLQLLPYTTLAMGAVFFEARRSTLPDEAPRLFPSFYAGVSFDANAFDAIATIFTQGRAASTALVTTQK